MGDYSTTQQQEEAPFPLTDTDKWLLSITDEEYPYHTWDELKRIIGGWKSLLSRLEFVLFVSPYRLAALADNS